MKSPVIKSTLLFCFMLLCDFTHAEDMLVKIGQPAPLPVAGYEHILWQRVEYAQGDCATPLEAIFYWSPNSISHAYADGYYTPYIEIHGGAWVGSLTFAPPTNSADAAAIKSIVRRGILYIKPTYRGQADIASHPEIGNCDHPRELIKDAEFIVGAIHARLPQIPVVDNIRPYEKIRVAGVSAGGHVAASLMVNHPEWFERAAFVSGIYDLQDWRANWDAHWSAFGDRNLAECDQNFDNKWAARTSKNQSDWFLTNASINCAKVPDRLTYPDALTEPRAYLITDVDDGDWVWVSGGSFSVYSTHGWWGTRNYDKFEDNNTIVDSSNGGAMPTMSSVVIEELGPGSIPLLSEADAKAKFVNPFAELSANVLSNLLNEPFLGLLPEAPILAENNFGQIIYDNNGEYAPFIMSTNTGDFTLQEQALAFCNAVQFAEGRDPNEIITQSAKGSFYECGDRGTLFIGVGGDHSTKTPYSALVDPTITNWLLNSWESSHAAKKQQEFCVFDSTQGAATFWGSTSNGFLFANWGGNLLGQGTYDSNYYRSEWDAIQNDPAYFGKDTNSLALPQGYPWSQLYLFSRGPWVSNFYWKNYQVCYRPLL